MIGSRIRIWIWSLYQKWLRWRFLRQQRDLGKGPRFPEVKISVGSREFSLSVLIEKSHYERYDGRVVRVIDGFEFKESSLDALKMFFNKVDYD